MATGGPDQEGQFIEVGQGILSVLPGIRMLRLTVPRTALGDIASWHQLYLAAKPLQVGLDVDGLAFLLHCPMTCSNQMREQGFLPGAALSHHTTVGGGAFSRDARPPGFDI
jgi:hypothetical protein